MSKKRIKKRETAKQEEKILHEKGENSKSSKRRRVGSGVGRRAGEEKKGRIRRTKRRKRKWGKTRRKIRKRRERTRRSIRVKKKQKEKA